jgi:hypothetical protein
LLSKTFGRIAAILSIRRNFQRFRLSRKEFNLILKFKVLSWEFFTFQRLSTTLFIYWLPRITPIALSLANPVPLSFNFAVQPKQKQTRRNLPPNCSINPSPFLNEISSNVCCFIHVQSNIPRLFNSPASSWSPEKVFRLVQRRIFAFHKTPMDIKCRTFYLKQHKESLYKGSCLSFLPPVGTMWEWRYRYIILLYKSFDIIFWFKKRISVTTLCLKTFLFCGWNKFRI